MLPTVSLSIVNWNGMQYIKKCLDSVYQQDYKGKIEIIIVDNFSQDGSLEFVEKNYKDIAILRNKTNRGFACGHNQAVKASNGQFILFLNFDVFLEPQFISQMVAAMEKNAKTGMLSGKLYKQFNGDKSNVLDSTGITMFRCFMSPRGEMEEDKKQHDAPEQANVFGVCGAAAFCRREALEDIRLKDEYFDEDFINYVEDVDLSWRLQLRGWVCCYNPNAIAYHERGVTRKNNKAMLRSYLVYGFRNRYCTMLKNFTWESLKKNKAEILFRELAFLFAKIREIPYSVRLEALIRALFMSVGMFVKRMAIQKVRIADEQYMESFFRYDKESFNKEMRHNLKMMLSTAKEKFKIKRSPYKVQ